ncbi:MAG: PPC domain-containing protein [Anaerolineae bacterium]
MYDRRRLVRYVCLLAGSLFSILIASDISHAEQRTEQAIRPLSELLNTDGTLNTNTGYSGSLDATGWVVTTGARGAPRFLRAETADARDTSGGELQPPSLTNPQAYPTPPTATPDPSWDNRFGPSGIYGKVNTVAVRGTDVYLGGSFSGADQTHASDIVHWDGQQWQDLQGGTGCASSYCDSEVNAILVVGSDIYVGGRFKQMGNLQVRNLARWDGQGWHDVGGGVGCDGSPSCGYYTPFAVTALATQAGMLYVGGQFDQAGNVSANNIVRWDGQTWTALGASGNNGVNGRVNAIAVAGNDVYVGGQFTRADGQSANNVARWDGQAWHDLGGGTDQPVAALTFGYGLLYVGLSQTGSAGGLEYGSLFGWDGQQWLYGSIGQGAVRSILIDGPRFYIGGSFSLDANGGAGSLTLARWSGGPSGHWVQVPDSPTSYSYPSGSVNALANVGEVLYVGGDITHIGVREIRGIAMWDGANWGTLSDGTDNGVHGHVYAVAIDGSDVYIGGQFSQVGQTLAENVARWDGQQWHPLGPGVTCVPRYFDYCYQPSVRAIAVGSDRVYVGGRFNQAGDRTVWNVAAWDGSAWSDLGVPPPTSYSDNTAQVNALALKGNLLYVGGDFSANSPLGAKQIAVWNGQTWSELGGGISQTQSYFDQGVRAIAVVGAKVYVGGRFDRAGNLQVTNIARWDGQEWSDMNGGLGCYGSSGCSGGSDAVSSLAIIGSDVYASGTFQHAADSSARFLARWDGSSWSPVGHGDIGGGYYSSPSIEVLSSDGHDLYIGGYFGSVDGVPAHNIAKWDGTNWFPQGSDDHNGIGRLESYSSADASAIAVVGRDVYVGGGFDTAGGWASQNFGHWHDSLLPPPTPLPTLTPTATFPPPPTPTQTVMPPSNDNFANAQVLAIPSQVQGTTAGGTYEIGEPPPSCGSTGYSVWYRVTPVEAGYLSVFVTTTTYGQNVEIFRGSTLASLSSLACEYLYYYNQAPLEVQADAGVTYYVRVAAGSYYNAGPFTLSVALDTVPHTPTPTSTATPTSTLTATPTPTRTPAPTSTPSGPPPTNDNFAAAQSLNVPGQVSGDTYNAGNEPGEPQACGNIGKTVWFSLTPTQNGALTAYTTGSSFDTVLAIYHGASLASLIPLQCNDDEGTATTSRVTVAVSGGQTYYIQVGGFSGDSGPFTLQVTLDTSTPTPTLPPTLTPIASYTPTMSPTPTLTLTPTLTPTETPALPPANDNFADAQTISVPGTTTGDTYDATREPSEPMPCAPFGATVWFRFTAPATGRLHVSTQNSDLDTVIALYSGPELKGLVLQACDDDSYGGGGWSVMGADILAGQTYYIQLGGYRGDTGECQLNLVLDVPTATPTVSATVTPTPTPTDTPLPSNTPTITQTPTDTVTPTMTLTSTVGPTPTVTATRTVPPKRTVSSTATNTPSVTITPTITATPTITPTFPPGTPLVYLPLLRR